MGDLRLSIRSIESGGITMALYDPMNLALLGGAAGLMNAGGPSRMPVSVGQGLSQGIMGGMQGYGQGQQFQLADQRMKFMAQEEELRKQQALKIQAEAMERQRLEALRRGLFAPQPPAPQQALDQGAAQGDVGPTVGNVARLDQMQQTTQPPIPIDRLQSAAAEGLDITPFLKLNEAATKEPASPYAKINPSQYTPESLKKYSTTRNVADLVAGAKPETDPTSYREWQRAKENGYKGTYESWAKFRTPSTTLSIDTHAKGKYADTVAEGTGKAHLEQFSSAQTAVKNISQNNDLLKLLRKGNVNTGLLAEVKTNVDRLKVMIAENEKAGKRVEDTQVADVMLGSQVFPMISSLGIGARGLDTPAEREFLRKVMTGVIPMEKATLVRMAEIRRNIAKREIEGFNARVDEGEYDEFFKQSMKPKRKIQLPADDDGSTPDTPAPAVIDFNSLPKRR